MMRFQASLERVDAALTLPQPARGRVVAELAADLEDLYAALRAEGLRAAEAEQRALALVLPDESTLRELDRLHQPAYRRLSERLTDRARLRFERTVVAFLSVGVVALAAAGLPLDMLLRDPSPFLLPVFVTGCAGLLVAVICGLRLFVVGASSPRDGARGLDFVLLLAAAAPYIAITGMTLDLYLALGPLRLDGAGGRGTGPPAPDRRDSGRVRALPVPAHTARVADVARAPRRSSRCGCGCGRTVWQDHSHTQQGAGAMFNLIAEGGFIMYPLLAATAAVVGYGLVAGRALRTASGPDPRLEATIDGVLFWGGFAFVLGLIGTLVGIVQAARAIERAGGAEAPLIWGGIRVALTSTIFALLLLGVAGLVWFALRRAYARRSA